MDLSKLKINDRVLFLDGTVAKVTRIHMTGDCFNLEFDRDVRGDYSSRDGWCYTKAGLWGYKPGLGNDIIKILEEDDGQLEQH